MRARQDGRYAKMMHRIGQLLRTKRHWQRLLLAGVLVCLLPVMGCSDSGDAGDGELKVKPPKVGDMWQDPVTGIEFVWIPKGCFKMGWVSGKIGHRRQKPVHKVCFEEGFWMGRYEVTQEQWQHVMGENPSHFNEERLGKDTRNHPVEMVSWDDIQLFLKKLNGEDGTGLYRLPSEAQWEYAARAGSETLYFFGDDADQLHEYAWYDADWETGSTHPVGQLKPNPWGLYDIYGNVDEWCADPYHKNYIGAPADGSVWETDGHHSFRIARGGKWSSSAYLTYSAVRTKGDSDDRSEAGGFRIVIPSWKTVVSSHK